MRYVLACCLAGLLGVAQAAGADEFYRGKTITIVTSTGPGGTYDLVARLIARHMPRHVPDTPSMVVQNMPGGGNVVATNYLYNLAPKDGTVIGTINNAIPLHQVIDGRGVRYDSDKFNWLGATGSRNSIVIVWRSTGVRNVEDLKTHEVTLGGTGPASSIVIFPAAMNNLLGTKFKIVNGYNSSAEVYIAMEKGEVESRSGSYTDLMGEHADWVTGNKVVFVVQIGTRRDRALADVPLLTELARNEEQRRIMTLISAPVALGQPFLAPPEVPAERVALLRRAFAETLADPAFLAEAAKLNVDELAIPAEEIARIVHDTVAAPPDIVAKAKAAMGAEQ
jgi:tripartite-type tricarboxylate transporter receptor subunit TctC